MLWVLQPSAPSRVQQKVFSEDELAGLQGQVIPFREEEPKDDLVHDILLGSATHPRYLLIAIVFEPRHGNVWQGYHAEEVPTGLW